MRIVFPSRQLVRGSFRSGGFQGSGSEPAECRFHLGPSRVPVEAVRHDRGDPQSGERGTHWLGDTKVRHRSGSP